MGRIRTIKPEFWTDGRVVQLPFEVRLLFIGMWNFADDDGYINDEPERIKMQVLPSDSVDASALVDLLVAAGLVERFISDDGSSFLKIKGFTKHQKISHKTHTKFPVNSGKKQNVPERVRRSIAIKYGCQPGMVHDATCYFCGAAGKIWWSSLPNGNPSSFVSFSGLELDHLVPESEGGETSNENIVLSCRFCNRSRGTKSADKFFMIRNSQNGSRRSPENSGMFSPEWKGKEKEEIEESEPLKKITKIRSKTYISSSIVHNEKFGEFWSAYPKRVSKRAAERKFEAALKSGVPPEQIIEAAKRYAAACAKSCLEKQFIKNPDSWLHAGRYLDEDLPSKAAPAPNGRSNGTEDFVLSVLKENHDDTRRRQESPTRVVPLLPLLGERK